MKHHTHERSGRVNRSLRFGPAGLGLAVAILAGCAGADNPTALDEIIADVEFEVGALEVETFEEVEIGVHANANGMPMEMTGPLLAVMTPGGGMREIHLEQEDLGFAAHVMFFEEGEHHLSMAGIPGGHRLMGEFGEMEVHVHLQHRVVGPYWIEMAVEPAPVFAGTTAHIHFFAYDVLADGSRGAPAGGLTLALEVHDPDAVETVVAVAEEDPGVYEGEFDFTAVGLFELHVEIDLGTTEASGEFHLPVFDADVGVGDHRDGDDDGAGGGHGDGGPGGDGHDDGGMGGGGNGGGGHGH